MTVLPVVGSLTTEVVSAIKVEETSVSAGYEVVETAPEAAKPVEPAIPPMVLFAEIAPEPAYPEPPAVPYVFTMTVLPISGVIVEVTAPP